MTTQNETLPKERKPLDMRRFLDDWVMLLAAVGIFVACTLLIDNFLSPLNMRGLGLAISTTGIAACTMLYCLASGHFDLSVGSVIACAGVVAAVVMRDTDSVFLGVAAALCMGLIVGLINGIVIAKLRVNALITTLATMQIVRGLAYIFANGKAVGVSQESFFVYGNGQLFGVPVPILITIVCFLFFGWLLNYTTYGRNTMAIGGNPEAALLALKVCDPACGSGHFLVAAAHRLAKALAQVRSGDDEYRIFLQAFGQAHEHPGQGVAHHQSGGGVRTHMRQRLGLTSCLIPHTNIPTGFTWATAPGPAPEHAHG